MSSSADAVIRVAPARSPGASRVTSHCRGSTVTGAPSAAGREVGRGDLQQVGVAVVHDPVLRAGQPGREPAAHRPGAAAEVVDHRGRSRAGAARGARRARASGPRRRPARAGRAIRADADAVDGHRAAPARTPAITDVVADQPASDARRSRAARAAGPQLGVAEPGAQRAAERRRVVRRHQQARPRAVGAVAEGLRYPAHLGGDDRKAAGQGLGDDHAVRLGARRQHQQVGGGVAAVELGAGPRAREAHAGRRARRPRRRRTPSANAGSRSRRPTQAQRQDRSVDRRERLEQHVVALAGGHRRDAEQRARRPRSPARGRRRRRRARRRAPGRPAARTARAAGAGSMRWS